MKKIKRGQPLLSGSSSASSTSGAIIALEIEKGGSLTFTAVQPAGSYANFLTYKWTAEENAIVVSPLTATTDIIFPKVTTDRLIGVTLTVTNTAGETAENSWSVMVTASEPGSDDDNEEPEPETSKYPQWSASVSYAGGSQVSHKGGNYQAKWWVTAGLEPGLATTTGPATGNSLPWMQI